MRHVSGGRRRKALADATIKAYATRCRIERPADRNERTALLKPSNFTIDHPDCSPR
jgi:hypothetical protein